ncbi:hypothetical protein ETB97_008132 [Aspergillus alliaceus]|uniref:Uncharacterized protein n=1 Tax=Petromyces alliaceus TaxID=209559 RepID=A0A8H6E2L9_PETAA|nr:hypothetical protein ETB97_008132 [Aspergillus burnettii]
MPTHSTRQDSSILGESWVVASPSLDKEERPNRGQPLESPGQSPPLDKEDDNYGCNSVAESMTTSASSMSGPELIMPSIYEAPIVEGSWVAPAVRSKSMSAHSLRRRQKTSRESTARKELHDLDMSRNGAAASEQGQDSSHIEEKLARPKLASSSNLVQPLIRTIINVLLVVAISHLLIIPEVVQQYQTLCTIEAVSTLYPASCIPPYPKPQPTRHRATRLDTVVSSQTRLESLFNTTLQEITPLSSMLKQSESKLRDIETELQRAQPGAKHELDLEFNGCWEATRAATRKFDSLKVDMRSAVDNLIATGGATAGDSASAAQDARFSTQISWREQYLDQLTARMQSKADSLLSDLATLDDHLESIGSILEREVKQSSTSSSTSDSGAESPGSGLRAFMGKLPPFLRQTKEDNSLIRPDPTIMELFQDAANQHRPVVDAVRQLSSGLQALQKRTP